MKTVPKIDGTAIEAAARAICIESGDKTDDLEPGNTPYDCFEDEEGEYLEVPVVDRKDSSGEPSFYTWRLYVGHAIAAMEALGLDLDRVDRPPRPLPSTPNPLKLRYERPY